MIEQCPACLGAVEFDPGQAQWLHCPTCGQTLFGRFQVTVAMQLAGEVCPRCTLSLPNRIVVSITENVPMPCPRCGVILYADDPAQPKSP